MPSNLEVCLEELNVAEDQECFVRCVAVSGGQPGLSLDRDGLVRWMPDEDTACHGLWVSADGRLMLHRTDGPKAVVVQRGERALEAPAGQPVVLLDQDLLRVGDRQLRLHVHGETEEIYEPEPYTRSAMMRWLQSAAAAATLVLGSTALAADASPHPAAGLGEPPPIEVRRRPPSVAARVRLDCTVKKQSVKKGKLHLEATCSSTNKLHVGQYGTLIDKKSGATMKMGTVQIESKKGKTIRVVSKYRKKTVKGVGKVRFWVSP